MAQAQHNPDRSTWGRRCSLGCQDWPDTLDFKVCLRCGEHTTRHSGLSPLPLDEAERLLRRAQFNAFYAKRCERLRIPVAGPLPDWYVPRTDLISASL